MREIADKLTGLRDEEIGEVAVKQAVTRFDVFHGRIQRTPRTCWWDFPGWRVVLGRGDRQVRREGFHE